MCKRTLSLYIQKPEPQKATKDLFLLIFSQARNGVGLKHSGTLWGVLESPSKKKQKIVSILPTRDLECIFIFVQFSKPVKFLMRYYLLVLVVLQRYFSSSSKHKCFFFQSHGNLDNLLSKLCICVCHLLAVSTLASMIQVCGQII